MGCKEGKQATQRLCNSRKHKTSRNNSTYVNRYILKLLQLRIVIYLHFYKNLGKSSDSTSTSGIIEEIKILTGRRAYKK